MIDKLRKQRSVPFVGSKRKSSTYKPVQTKLQFEHLEQRLALTVVINEFLAANDSGIVDLAGHRHDWIELKNTGVVAENVSGWYLTDNASDLTKYQIPAAGALTTLDPGEILLVYASGNSSEIGLIGSEIHTNFQLSQEPGYLALVQSNGLTIEDEFNLYQQQTIDVSFGIGPSVSSTTTDTLITTGTAALVRVFDGPDVTVDDFWTEINYPATAGDGWVNTTTGVGWDNDGGGVYTGLIPTPISSFSSPDISAYVRVPFTVNNKSELVSMNLELIADDAYIVFLNGRQVTRDRLNTTLSIGEDWELNARRNLPDSVIANEFKLHLDMTAWLGVIEEGNNVLAIYGANHTSQQNDFLIHPVLTVERANGSETDGFLAIPSPGLENGATYDGFIEDTLFSHDRGFYDAPFSLSISANAPGTTIRYTTDGSIPTMTNGMTFNNAINIDPSTSIDYAGAGVVTVRAAAFRENFISTNVDTQTYVFLDELINQDSPSADGNPNSIYTAAWGHVGADWGIDITDGGGSINLKSALKAIPTMSLVTDWGEMWGVPVVSGVGAAEDYDGIYTQKSSWSEKSDERASSLEYFSADGSEEFQVDASVEIQGHSSADKWNNDKLSFQVKFKVPYDTKLDSASLLGNSVADGLGAASSFDTLILDAHHNFTFTHNNNTAQNPYPRYINDQVVADLINLSGGDSPHGRWVHLYVNGMYWGIYNAHERPDAAFAAEYFGGNDDDYYAIKAFDGIGKSHGGTQPEYLQTDGGLTAEAAYQAFLNEVDDGLSSLSQYQDVEQILDIDPFIDYMIIHYYAGNWDWGQDNWFATFNHVDPNGKWRFHAWDQEHAFNTNESPDGHGPTSDYTTKNDIYGPTGIHIDLMASAEYRLRFSDRVEELMRNGGLLTPTEGAAVFQARIDELSLAIYGEAARWADNRLAHSVTNWTNSVQSAINSWFPGRTNTVIGQFDTRGWLVALEAPNFNQYGGEIVTGFDLTMSNPNGSGTIYYTLDGTDPREVGGGISSAAFAYNGAVDLAETTQVRARIRTSPTDWSAEVNKVFTLATPLSLRIVELMYHPADAGNLEYIELLNIGNAPVDLTGVQITDFSTGGYTFNSQTLGAGQRIVVPEDVAQFQARYPTVTNVTSTAYSGNLSNGGEVISLRDGFGNLLQSFTFDDVVPWPTTSDGGGPSLEYIGPLNAGEDPLDGSPLDPFDDPANWQASLQNGGSPGTDGQTTLASADFDGDDDVDGRDFLAWQRGYGISAPNAVKADGDANNDTAVDDDDLGVWQLQYAMTQPLTVSALVEFQASEFPAEPLFVSTLTHSDLVEVAQTEALAKKTDRTSAAVNVIEQIAMMEVFASEPFVQSDAPLDSPLSDLSILSIPRDDDVESSKETSLWEEAVDEVFANALK